MKLNFYLFTLVSLFQLMSYGQTFNVDDINYNITSSTEPLTVEVAHNPMLMSSTVVIPQTVIYDSNTYAVTSIGEAAFIDSFSLRSVIIPDSVTSIGNIAFALCHSLTSVTIPNSVILIGEQAFDHCTSLKSVNIGNSVTSIGNLAFGMCLSLTTIVNNSTTPLVINPSVFDNNFGPSVNRTLYVPYSAVAAYQNTAVWQDFNPILPINVSATHLNFDGVDDYVDCGNLLPTSYTKEAWIYLDAITYENNIISGSDNFGQHALWAPNGVLSAGHNGMWNSVEDSNVLELNTWYHVAVSYDSPTQTLKLYKDGVLIDTNNNMMPPINGNEINIGSYNDAGNLFNGSIDEVRVWNGVRTIEQLNETKNIELQGDEADLLVYYNFNQGLDSQDNTLETVLLDGSENTTHGTLNNFALSGSTSNWKAGSPIGTPATHLNFDGVDDYIVLTNSSAFNFTDQMTIEFWMKSNDTPEQWDALVTKGDQSWRIALDSSGQISFAGNGAFGDIQSDISVVDNIWHHIAVTYNGIEARIFIDGELNIAHPSTGDITSSTLAVAVGENLGAIGRYFKGDIDDIRIWDIARTPNQINGSKNCELQGSEAGLIGYYKFNQGLNDGYNLSELQLIDASGNGNDGILNSFTLSGTTSNWLKGSPITSGVVIPTAPTVDGQTFCGSATVADLEILGTALVWYNSETSNTALIASTDLETGTYYVSDSNANGCESERIEVSVAINDLPEVPTVTASITYNQGDDASELMAITGGTGLLWYNSETGGTGVETAPTPDTSTLGSTSYWVASTNDIGCESERLEIVVQVEETLGINENEMLKNISIYPNPTKAYVMITFSNKQESKITVYDLNGRLLLNQSNTNGNFKIDLSGYATGVYLLKIKVNQNEIIKRILKH